MLFYFSFRRDIMRYLKLSLFAAVTAVSVAGVSNAAIFPEMEPNDTKAAANPVALVGVGDVITGLSTGSSTTVAGSLSADNFLLTTPVQPAGIYRNRLTLTTNGTAGHTGSIRGLTQTATGTNVTGPGTINAGTDASVQSSTTSTTPARFNQFYTFGPSTRLTYRVTGTSSTTVDYNSTWSQDVVTPVSLGSFVEGSYVFTNLGLASTQDTEVFVLDSSLTPIGFNDDSLDTANGGPIVPVGSNTLNSYLPITLTPGSYTLAISNFNTASSQASTGNEGTANASVLDAAGILANGSSSIFATIPFSIIGPGGTTAITATKPGGYDIYFASFTVTVVPEPTTLVGLAGASLMALARRRK